MRPELSWTFPGGCRTSAVTRRAVASPRIAVALHFRQMTMMRNAFTIFSAASVCCLGVVVFLSLPPHLKIGGQRANLVAPNSRSGVSGLSLLFADHVAPENSDAALSSTNSPHSSSPEPAVSLPQTSFRAGNAVRPRVVSTPKKRVGPSQLPNPREKSSETRVIQPKPADLATTPLPKSTVNSQPPQHLTGHSTPPGFSDDSHDAAADSGLFSAESPSSNKVATSASAFGSATKAMSEPEFHEFTEPSETNSATAFTPDAQSARPAEDLFAATESATDAASESAGPGIPDNLFDPDKPHAESPTTETTSPPDSPTTASSDSDAFTLDAELSSNASQPAEPSTESPSTSQSDTFVTPDLAQQPPLEHQPTIGELLVEEAELPSFSDETDEEDLFASDLSAPDMSSADLNTSAETIATAPSTPASPTKPAPSSTAPQSLAKGDMQTHGSSDDQRTAFHKGDDHDQIEILFDVSELANRPTTLSPPTGNQPTQVTASKPQRLSVEEDQLPTLEIPQRITVKATPGILLPELEFEEWTNCGVPRGGPANGGTLVRPFFAKTVSPTNRTVSRVRGSLEDMFEKITRVDFSLPGWRRPRSAQPMAHRSGNTANPEATKRPTAVPSRNSATHAQQPSAPPVHRRMLTSAAGKPIAPSGVIRAGWSVEDEEQSPASKSADRRTGAAR